MIPEKKDQAANRMKKGRRGGRPIAHDTELYKDRNTVERTINKIKDAASLSGTTNAPTVTKQPSNSAAHSSGSVTSEQPDHDLIQA